MSKVWHTYRCNARLLLAIEDAASSEKGTFKTERKTYSGTWRHVRGFRAATQGLLSEALYLSFK